MACSSTRSPLHSSDTITRRRSFRPFYRAVMLRDTRCASVAIVASSPRGKPRSASIVRGCCAEGLPCRPWYPRRAEISGCGSAVPRGLGAPGRSPSFSPGHYIVIRYLEPILSRPESLAKGNFESILPVVNRTVLPFAIFSGLLVSAALRLNCFVDRIGRRYIGDDLWRATIWATSFQNLQLAG
jgi:hypothetical protein